MFHIFSTIALVIFLPLNYYIGSHFRQIFRSFIPGLPSRIFWIGFWLLSFSLFIPQLNLGYYWVIALFYLFLCFLSLDLINFLGKRCGLAVGFTKSPYTDVAAIVLVFLIILYGSWNARNPRITHYNISIPKEAGEIKQLHVVMVSDIHYGELVDERRLENLVAAINRQKPDLVLMPGDIIQQGQTSLTADVIKTLGQLKPKLGTYASLGNHEYFGGQVNNTVTELEKSGIHVLRDQYTEIANSLYIVGLEDSAGARFSNQKRKSLAEVLTGIDKKIPIILLNHQPVDLSAAQEQGVDLQLSGHTHGGQIFPANLITSAIFEQDWGYLQKGTLQLIVSCGFGTWGPSLRIGTRSEIVDLTINFK